jgi:hypothetical protein
VRAIAQRVDDAPVDDLRIDELLVARGLGHPTPSGLHALDQRRDLQALPAQLIVGGDVDDRAERAREQRLGPLALQRRRGDPNKPLRADVLDQVEVGLGLEVMCLVSGHKSPLAPPLGINFATVKRLHHGDR